MYFVSTSITPIILASILKTGRKVGIYGIVITPPLSQFPLWLKILQSLHRIGNRVVVFMAKIMSRQAAHMLHDIFNTSFPSSPFHSPGRRSEIFVSQDNVSRPGGRGVVLRP